MSGISISKYYGLYQGLPAASGTLNVYQTGTTTPVTPYADALLITPLSNPITLDANGCAVFYYAGTVNLKLVAYTASGSLIETLDPVYPNGSGTSGSASVPWVVAGGTADIITATYNPVITALSDGLLLSFRASAANTTTTPTFAPNGLTAYDITAFGGATLLPGNITANFAEYLVRYNLANTRWELLNPTGISNISAVTTYQVTSAADITVAQLGSVSNVGTTASITIPTHGEIKLFVTGEVIAMTTTFKLVFGIKIGSTSYLPLFTDTGGNDYCFAMGSFANEGTCVFSGGGGIAISGSTAYRASQEVILGIEALSIPTGVQTVQIVVGNEDNATTILKGTVVTTRVNITVVST